MILKLFDLRLIVSDGDSDHFDLVPGGRIRLNHAKKLLVQGRLLLTGQTIDVKYLH